MECNGIRDFVSPLFSISDMLLAERGYMASMLVFRKLHTGYSLIRSLGGQNRLLTLTDYPKPTAKKLMP